MIFEAPPCLAAPLASSSCLKLLKDAGPHCLSYDWLCLSDISNCLKKPQKGEIYICKALNKTHMWGPPLTSLVSTKFLDVAPIPPFVNVSSRRCFPHPVLLTRTPVIPLPFHFFSKSSYYHMYVLYHSLWYLSLLHTCVCTCFYFSSSPALYVLKAYFMKHSVCLEYCR